MMELEFFVDSDGCPRASGVNDQLRNFLESDLQGALELVDELLIEFSLAQTQHEFTGNAHSVTLSDGSVVIESLYDENAAPFYLSHAAFLGCIYSWRTFLNEKV